MTAGYITPRATTLINQINKELVSMRYFESIMDNNSNSNNYNNNNNNNAGATGCGGGSPANKRRTQVRSNKRFLNILEFTVFRFSKPLSSHLFNDLGYEFIYKHDRKRLRFLADILDMSVRFLGCNPSICNMAPADLILPAAAWELLDSAVNSSESDCELHNLTVAAVMRTYENRLAFLHNFLVQCKRKHNEIIQKNLSPASVSKQRQHSQKQQHQQKQQRQITSEHQRPVCGSARILIAKDHGCDNQFYSSLDQEFWMECVCGNSTATTTTY